MTAIVSSASPDPTDRPSPLATLSAAFAAATAVVESERQKRAGVGGLPAGISLFLDRVREHQAKHPGPLDALGRGIGAAFRPDFGLSPSR